MKLQVNLKIEKTVFYYKKVKEVKNIKKVKKVAYLSSNEQTPIEYKF